MRVLLVAATQLTNHIPGYVPHYPGFGAPTDSDELAEEAGRLCYGSWNRPNPNTATNRGYLGNIISMGHFSVLEHASATFYVDGVSRNFTHELIRHRHLSFSEVSQRYVDVSNYRVVVPPVLRPIFEEESEEDNLDYDPETGTHTMDDTFHKHQYQEIMELLSDLPRKEARQAARFALPSGLETKIVVTGNMGAWREVLQKRLSKSADLEFQLVAYEILKALRVVAPNTFQDIFTPAEQEDIEHERLIDNLDDDDNYYVDDNYWLDEEPHDGEWLEVCDYDYDDSHDEILGMMDDGTTEVCEAGL